MSAFSLAIADGELALQKQLPRTGGKSIELHVRSVLTGETTTEGCVH